MGISIEPPGPGVVPVPAASLSNYGKVTGPAASAVIATITSPPAGVYTVTLYNELSGTVAAADQDNIKLLVDGVTITTLPLSAVIASGDVQPPLTITVKSSGTSIVVEAVGAATGTAVYSSLIIATKVA